MSYILTKPVNENQRREQVKSQETSAALNEIRLSIRNETNQRQNDDGVINQNLSFLREVVNSEITLSAAADTEIWAALNSTTATLTASDTFIVNLIGSETAIREISEGQLRDAFNTAVDNETTARMQADENLRVALLATINSGTSLQAITDENLRNQIASETAIRNAALTNLQAALSSETAVRTSEDARVLGAVSTEIANRQSADATLNANLTAAISSESALRSAAINDLRDEINATLADNLNDFTKTKHGLVPVPPSGNAEQILTQNGWRPVTSSTIYINDTPSQFGTLTFNNTTQTPTFLNYDTAKLQISGTTSAKNAGNYIAKFTPKDLYVWGSDNTQSTKDVGWSIQVLKLPKPAAAQIEFDYTGSPVSISVNNFNSTYINQSGTATATEPGNYTVTYSLKSTSNTKWEDNSTGSVSIAWEIAKRDLTEEQSGPFAQAGNLTFNGQLQTVTISNYDSNYHTLGGTYQSTNAGNFVATVSPKAGYSWFDGSNTAQNVDWSIAPATVAKPYADVVSFAFDGNSKNLQVTNYDSALMTQAGTLSATDAGDYTVTYSLKNKNNYTWADDSTDDVVINWAIGSQRLNKPDAATKTFTYSGDAKTLVVSNFDADFMTESGTKVAIDAGTYTVTYSLKDTAKAKWADGSTADVTITWTINRKPLTATQSNLYLETDTFIFNFEEQHVNCINFDANFHDYIGTMSITYGDGLQQFFIVTPKANYCWNDGSITGKQFNWRMMPLVLAEITTVNQTYDGSLKTVQFLMGGQSFDQDTYIRFRSSSVKTATNAGTYTVNLEVAISSLRFADGSKICAFNWTIDRANLTAAQSTFAQDGSLTFNGANQTVTIANYNASIHVLSGTTSATNAGDYEANVDPNSNYAWSDGSTDTKIVNWTINQKSVDVPTAAQIEFAYDGSAHSLDITGFDSTFINKSGDETKTAAGSYQLTFSLKDAVNTRWADGSTDAKVIEWSIGMTKISAPIPANINFTYNGNEQAPTFTGFDSDTMTISGTQAATSAGTYSVIFNLKDASTTVWDDNSTSAVSYEWKINRKPLTAAQSTFAQSGELTYNGLTQTVTISNFDENYHVLGGTFQAYYAGTYEARVYPADNFCFNDGSTAYIPVQWSIAILKIAKPVIIGDSIFFYDRQKHTLNVGNLPESSRIIGGNGLRSAFYVGNYSIKYDILYPNSCHWADDTTDSVTLNWAIVKRTFAKPAAASTIFTYNGSAKTLSISNFDADFMNVNGTLEATDAGDYSVTYSLKDKGLHTWADGSTDDVIISWTINRQALNSTYNNITALAYSSDIKNITYTGEQFDISEPISAASPNYKYLRRIISSTSAGAFDTSIFTISGDFQETDAGTYSFTLTPTANYAWNDGSTEARSFNWTIEPYTLPEPYLDPAEFTYDGTEKSPTIVNLIEGSVTIGGTTSRTNATTGANGVYVSLMPTDNYVWSDGSKRRIYLYWRINRQPLTPQQSNITTSFTKNYTGSNIVVSASECGIDTAYISFFTKTTTTIEIGTYLKATATPKNNYCWSDGSTAAKNIYLTIRDPDEDSSSGVRAPLITSDSEFTFDGSAKSITVDFNSNFSEVKTGYLSATDAGDYSVVYKLKSASYTWKDGTTADKTLTWKINRKPLTETQSTFTANSLTYNGEIRTVTIKNFNSNYHEKGGTYTATNVGTYTATVTPKSNYCWDDGTFDAKNVSWTIDKRYLFNPTVTRSYEFTGSDITLAASWFVPQDINWVTQSGTFAASDVGTYTATFAIVDKNNSCWLSGSTADLSFTWKITPIYLEKPYADITQIQYTGEMITLHVTGYSPATMNTTGYVNQWLEGDYTKTYSLKDKVNYRWADGSTDDVVINWAITPIQLTAAQSVISQTNSLTFNGQNQRPRFNDGAEYIGTGAIVAQSDAGTYTASVTPVNGYVWNDGTKTAKSVEWVINKADRTDTYKAELRTQSPSSSLGFVLDHVASQTLSLNKLGTGNFSITTSNADKCAVSTSGSNFTLTAGKNGGIVFHIIQEEDTNYFATDITCSAQIRRNLADFTWAQIASFTRAGTLLDYCAIGNSKDISIDATVSDVSISGTFTVNLIGYNHNASVEGNNRAHFCINKIGNAFIAFVDSYYGTETSHGGFHPYPPRYVNWLNSGSGLLPALPSDLQAVITACTKYQSYSPSQSYAFKLWILDKYEIDGVSMESHAKGQARLQQYEYFKNGNGLTRYKFNAITQRAIWWTRTYAEGAPNTYYAFNSSSGNFDSYDINFAYGIVPCFTIS